jgi:hypothetical protein
MKGYKRNAAPRCTARRANGEATHAPLRSADASKGSWQPSSSAGRIIPSRLVYSFQLGAFLGGPVHAAHVAGLAFGFANGPSGAGGFLFAGGSALRGDFCVR